MDLFIFRAHTVQGYFIFCGRGSNHDICRGNGGHSLDTPSLAQGDIEATISDASVHQLLRQRGVLSMPAPRSHKNIGGQSAGATRHFLVFLEVLKHGIIKVYEVFFLKDKICHYGICGYTPSLTSIPELFYDKLQRKTRFLESNIIGLWSNILPNPVSHKPT